MSIACTAPFAVGDRVVLRSPENPKHPRRGRIGTVLRTRFFEAVVQTRFRSGIGLRSEILAAATWMAVVAFDPNGAPDRFDELKVGRDWRCFEGELAITTKGTTP